MPLKKIIWYTFPLKTVGGGERLLLEGLKWFKENGIDPYLFADGEPINNEALFDGSYSPQILFYNKPKPKKYNLLGRLIYLFNKIKFLKQHNPDVIIANSQAEASKIYFFNIFSTTKLPYVCFIHGSFFQFPDDTDKYAPVFRKSFSKILQNDPVYKELIPSHAPPTPVLKRIKRNLVNYFRFLAVRNSKAVFVLTEKAKEEIILLYKHSNVVVAHGAFSKDIYDYRLKEDKKAKWNITDKITIFSMCRLVDKKRVDVIIKAFAVFYKKRPESILLIGGNGPEKENLQFLAKQYGIDHVVKFLGYVPDHELLDYYLSSDIFVTADNADYDITTFVALALGKKVVASSQHEFEKELETLNLLFHAAPTDVGFAEAFEIAYVTEKSKGIMKEKVLQGYTWEHYFGRIKKEMEKISLSCF